MSGLRVKHVLVFVGAFCCVLWTAPGFAERHSQHQSSVKEAAAKPAPQPLTLQEMPASPPQVEYHNGELTIVAENSTLGDILRAVRTQTGANVDIPPNATERVVSHLGPGPARQILAELLNGTRFNYVMLGSASDPNALAQVILTLKPPPGPETTASRPPAQAFVPPPADTSNDSSDSDDDADDTDSVPAPAPVAAPQSSAPTVKTPQQLLEELRRQLEQEQQQNSQPGQPPAPARPR